jgi:biopolymer transport protein ExbD
VISLVPMIDVMLILLVFFMVTSTYLNLDMIPAAQRSDDNPESSRVPDGSTREVLMIRLGADGVPTVRGQSLTGSELETMLALRAQTDPDIRVLILPSGAADMQALIGVMDTATRVGATNVSVVRLEALE